MPRDGTDAVKRLVHGRLSAAASQGGGPAPSPGAPGLVQAAWAQAAYQPGDLAKPVCSSEKER